MKELYYDWMLSKVCPTNARKLKYSKLFRCLNEEIFHYNIPLDANRESDGIDLRYRFSYECNIKQAEVAYFIDQDPMCTVLEMMVALAIRLESVEHRSDDGLADVYFWEMIDSLGLSNQEDKYWDDDIIFNAIERFMFHDFDPDTGEGGLFTLENNYGTDLRTVEIWCLAMWHLSEVAGYA